MKKKKLLNRLLSALLAVIMTIGLIPMGSVTVKAETKNATLSNLGALGTVKIGSKAESGTWYQTEVAGTPVFCLDLGKACHAGDVYVSSDATYSSNSSNAKKANEAKIGYWYSVTKNESTKSWVYAQALMWACEEGETSEKKLTDVISQVRKNTGYYDSKSAAELYAEIFKISATVSCKIKMWKYGGSGSYRQVLLEIVGTPILPVYEKINDTLVYRQRITIDKTDEDGKGLKVDAVEGEKKLRLGEGLLNDASKDVIKMRIVNLDRNKIRKNSKNNYSIKDIDSLAESIRIYGIASPLNVKKINDNEYMLLGGERRITAIDKLIEDPNVPEWNEDTLIPCTIKDLDKIKLPLSDEAKEQYALITTNKEARKYTDADRYIEVQAWKRIIDELRANGVDTINMEDKDIQIKGEKTRDILARTTGMSQGQIQRYNKVENNATANLINSVLDDEISIGVAERAVDILTPREQDSLAEAARSQKIAPIDVDTFKKEEPKEEYTDKVNSDVEELLENIKNKKIYFTEKQEREYTKLIKKLANILNK